MSLVLMYHGLGDAPAPRAELRYTVNELRFREQLQALRGRPVLSLAALLSGRAPLDSVVLSFDDGEKTVATRALPLLRALGWTGVLYMTSGWIGTPGYCTAEDLQELLAAGWEIGAHGVSHRFLDGLNDRELTEELRGARQQLTGILGQPVRHLSLPGGRGGRRVRDAARAAGYLSIATSLVGRTGVNSDPFAIRRVAVQRGCSATWLARVAAGDPRLLLRLRARQALLDGARRTCGEEHYRRLRAAALQLRRWLAVRSG